MSRELVKFRLMVKIAVYLQGVSKKTEFCQIEHLLILPIIGEKYLMKFVANPVVSCFESAISNLLLGAL